MTGQACPLRFVARSEDRGYVASGSRSAPGVPLKISMVTPPHLGALLHGCCTKAPERIQGLCACLAFYPQIVVFYGWAMLGSNQRPLPCEGSVIVCWRFLELAKLLQITVFSLKSFSQ